MQEQAAPEQQQDEATEADSQLDEVTADWNDAYVNFQTGKLKYKEVMKA